MLQRKIMKVSAVVPTLLCEILVQNCGVPWVLPPSYSGCCQLLGSREYLILIWPVHVCSRPNNWLLSSLVHTVCLSQRFSKYVFHSISVNKLEKCDSKSGRERYFPLF